VVVDGPTHFLHDGVSRKGQTLFNHRLLVFERQVMSSLQVIRIQYNNAEKGYPTTLCAKPGIPRPSNMAPSLAASSPPPLRT